MARRMVGGADNAHGAPPVGSSHQSTAAWGRILCALKEINNNYEFEFEKMSM